MAAKDKPLSEQEINDIGRHLMAAATPNSPNRVLTSWRVVRPGAIWELNPIDGPVVELYRHEIVHYVGMLKAAGIEPKPIRWPRSKDDA